MSRAVVGTVATIIVASIAVVIIAVRDDANESSETDHPTPTVLGPGPAADAAPPRPRAAVARWSLDPVPEDWNLGLVRQLDRAFARFDTTRQDDAAFVLDALKTVHSPASTRALVELCLATAVTDKPRVTCPQKRIQSLC
jgi:hypothetical protein